MKSVDVVTLAWQAVARHRLRTGLSLLGVAIGVCAVVLLTALGEGARQFVTGQFQALGTNLLVILPGKTETTGALPGFGGAPNDLTLDDAEALQRGLPSAELVVPLAVGNETVSHRERRRQVTVIGTSSDFLEARKLGIAYGSFLPELDWDRAAPVAVLGTTTAAELFGNENPLGELIRVGDARTRVVGVLEAKGTQMGLDMDDLVIVPVMSTMRLFNRTSLFRILIQIGNHRAMDAAKERAIAIITERHGEEDITCVTQESVSGGLVAILAVLTLAIAGIAAISLSVAGIGIMNVMLVSVSERTSEVGLLRALGARRRQIVALFLVEAVLLSTAGALVGLVTSWIATRAIAAWYPSFPVEAPLWAVAASLGTALAIGTLFGVLPARHASRLDPVVALASR